MSGLVLANTHPVARVQHHCELCGRRVEPGERYRNARIVGDDGPYTWKECAHCSAMIHLTDVAENAHGEGYGTDDFCDWEPCTIREARWKAQWKRHWRRRDGALYPVPTTAVGAEARP